VKTPPVVGQPVDELYVMPVIPMAVSAAATVVYCTTLFGFLLVMEYTLPVADTKMDLYTDSFEMTAVHSLAVFLSCKRLASGVTCTL
jgi:hypothetical protein